MEEEEKSFYIDTSKDTKVSYSGLLEDLNKEEILFSPIIYTADYYDIFFQIILSILLDRSITILDYDFSDQELENLGFSISIIEESKVSVKGREMISVPQLLEGLHKSIKWGVNLYTSGTTGLPKKVNHDLRSLTKGVRINDKHKNSIWGLAYNPTHIAGLQVFFQALFNGNTIVRLFGIPINIVYKSLIEFEITNISATPTYYRLLITRDKQFCSVEKLTMGGERFDISLSRGLKQMFPKAILLNVYASTEAGTIIAAKGEVFEIDQSNRALVRIREGELFLHSSIMGKSLTVQLQNEWYATGDLVEVISNEPLLFKFLSRKNEMINVGGYKVNPVEIEDVLLAMEAIREARVFGKKNSVLGNLVHCEVVMSNLEHDWNVKKLRNYLGTKLQPFKVPRIIKFVPEISRTRTGKKKRL